MDPVDEIFAAFGNSPTKLARAAHMDVRTVDAWKRIPKKIPKWRREKVLEAVLNAGVVLSSSALAYLRDTGSEPARPPAIAAHGDAA